MARREMTFDEVEALGLDGTGRSGGPYFETEFTFDDETTFVGITDGSTWNGFLNVRVTETVLDAIVEHFRETMSAAEFAETMGDWPKPGPGGLIDLSGGYATREIEWPFIEVDGRRIALEALFALPAEERDTLIDDAEIGVGHGCLDYVETGSLGPICGVCRAVLEVSGDALVVLS